VCIYKKEFYFIEVIDMLLQQGNNAWQAPSEPSNDSLLAITNIAIIIFPLELFLKIINHISV